MNRTINSFVIVTLGGKERPTESWTLEQQGLNGTTNKRSLDSAGP